MNWTFERAFDKAQIILSSPCVTHQVDIVENATQEFDVGWVFFYQSSSFLKTGDAQEALVGNARLFVSRKDGQAKFIGYCNSIAQSIDAYRACGDPNVLELPQLRLTGFSECANKLQPLRQFVDIRVSHLLRRSTLSMTVLDQLRLSSPPTTWHQPSNFWLRWPTLAFLGQSLTTEPRPSGRMTANGETDGPLRVPRRRQALSDEPSAHPVADSVLLLRTSKRRCRDSRPAIPDILGLYEGHHPPDESHSLASLKTGQSAVLRQ